MKIKTALQAIVTLFSVVSAQENYCFGETEKLGEINDEEWLIVEKSDKIELENLLR